MQSKQLKDMDEETKTGIGSFVKSADNYQNLVISNLPNVAVYVLPNKKSSYAQSNQNWQRNGGK